MNIKNKAMTFTIAINKKKKKNYDIFLQHVRDILKMFHIIYTVIQRSLLLDFLNLAESKYLLSNWGMFRFSVIIPGKAIAKNAYKNCTLST